MPYMMRDSARRYTETDKSPNESLSAPAAHHSLLGRRFTALSESTELQRAVEQLTQSINELRTELVRKDVYASDQRGLNQRLSGIEAGLVTVSNTVEKIEERRAADRRLLLTSFGLPLLLILIQLYLASQGVAPS